MNLDKLREGLTYALGKKRELQAGKAVGFVATNPDWADKRPAFAAAVDAAAIAAYQQRQPPRQIGRAAVRAACLFITAHS